MRRLAGILGSRPARFVALFTLLVLPWPAVGRVYGRVVATVAGALTDNAEAGVAIRFPAGTEEPAPDAWKLRVHAEDTTTGRYVGTVLDLRRSGYIASALFAALALLTPLRPRRRIGLLLGGLALLQILPLLPLLSFFSGKLPVQAFHLGPATRAGVEIAYHTLVAPPGMAYAVPALLWLLLVWALGLPQVTSKAGIGCSTASPSFGRLRSGGS